MGVKGLGLRRAGEGRAGDVGLETGLRGARREGDGEEGEGMVFPNFGIGDGEGTPVGVGGKEAGGGEAGDGAESGGNEGGVYVIGDAGAADTWAWK